MFHGTPLCSCNNFQKNFSQALQTLLLHSMNSRSHFLGPSSTKPHMTTLMSAPTLDHSKRQDYFILTTDALDVGLSIVLCTSRKTTIEFASWTLTFTVHNITEGMLAVIWATHRFWNYLLRTNRKPLERLESYKQSMLTSSVYKGSSYVPYTFNFNIVYYTCWDNQYTDSLSQMPISLFRDHYLHSKYLMYRSKIS